VNARVLVDIFDLASAILDGDGAAALGALLPQRDERVTAACRWAFL
jgi:hypothetical protein